MVSGLRIDGGTQILPARVRKTIQSIKEIVGNHSDADIYTTLKETNMDPNETAQKLLNQGFFFFLFFFFILCSSRPFFSSCFVTLPLLEDLSFFRRENGFKQFVGPHSFVGCFCFAFLCIFSFYFGGSRVWPVTVTNGRRLLLSRHWERFVLDDLERH